MFRWLAQGIFGLLGWRVANDIPADLNKFVLVAAPHTSWMDFFVGLFTRSIIRRDIKFLGKKGLFKPPLGWIMRSLGGYPVDRSVRHNLVDQVVEIFNQQDDFAIALAPEGTRKKVASLKSGFYYIAAGANVPIILTKMDYGNRLVHLSKPFYPTGDPQADLSYIWEYFRGVKGKRPASGIS